MTWTTRAFGAAVIVGSLALIAFLVLRQGGAAFPKTDGGGLCPEEFEYLPGGKHWIIRTGERWGPSASFRYEIELEPFCLARYEASLPGATGERMGDYVFGGDIPPAQVKRGVKPWVRVSWLEAFVALHQQGWRFPTYEELQVAATGGEPKNIWPFGPRWDCVLSEDSWFETCAGLRNPVQGAGVTGGPAGGSNYKLPFFDFLGNVSEMTGTPWDVRCHGFTRFSLFGHSFHGGHQVPWINAQESDPEKPECWHWTGFDGTTRGEHTHDLLNRTYADDGFRPAAAPSPRWAARVPLSSATRVKYPLEGWYYDHETGKKKSYKVPLPEDWAQNHR